MKNTSRHMMTDAEQVKQFVFAGKARVTLVSQKTDVRFTYRITRAKNGANPPYFVSVLTGNDNERSYQYFGLYRNGDFEHGRKSKVDDRAISVRAWRYFNAIVLGRGVVPNDLEVWHEGKCGRCGKALTVPESIARGIGPECWSRMH